MAGPDGAGVGGWAWLVLPRHRRADEIAWYQGGRDVCEVGLLNLYVSETPLIRGVEVDPDGGWVVRPLVREWDRELDGYPGP